MTLHQHNWCPNLKGIFESIILGQLSLSLIVQQIGKRNEKPRLLVEHIDCLYRDVLELIYGCIKTAPGRHGIIRNVGD